MKNFLYFLMLSVVHLLALDQYSLEPVCKFSGEMGGRIDVSESDGQV
jgi:hypothetical protein